MSSDLSDVEKRKYEPLHIQCFFQEYDWVYYHAFLSGQLVECSPHFDISDSLNRNTMNATKRSMANSHFFTLKSHIVKKCLFAFTVDTFSSISSFWLNAMNNVVNTYSLFRTSSVEQ